MSPVCNPTVRIVLAVVRRDLTALVEAITELNGPASASGAVGADASIPMSVALPRSCLPEVLGGAEAGGSELAIINIPVLKVPVPVEVRSDQANSCFMPRANTSTNDVVFMRTALCGNHPSRLCCRLQDRHQRWRFQEYNQVLVPDSRGDGQERLRIRNHYLLARGGLYTLFESGVGP